MEDDRSPPVDDSLSWSAALAQSLEDERRRALEFLTAQQESLEQVEGTLAEQIQAAAAELTTAQQRAAQQQDQLQQRAEAIRRQNQELSQLKQELELREQRWEREQQHSIQEHQAGMERLRSKQADLERQSQDLEAATAKLRQSQRALASAQDEHEAEVEQLARRRNRFDEQQRLLEAERGEVETRSAATKDQRRRIAQQLKAQRVSQLQELELRRKELEHQLGPRAPQDLKLDALVRERDALRQQLTEATARLEQLQSESSATNGPAREDDSTVELLARGNAEQMAQLCNQCQTLRDTVATLEQQIARQQAALDERVTACLAAEQLAGERQSQLDDAWTRGIVLEQQVTQFTQERDALQASCLQLRDEVRQLQEDLVQQEHRLTDAQAEATAQRTALRQSEIHCRELDERLSRSQINAGETASELQRVRGELQKFQDGVQPAIADAAHDDHVADLQARYDLLAQRLTEAEASVPESVAPADAHRAEDMQRRFEMAIEDVRDLKRRNAELEERLSRAKAAGPAPTSDVGQDWESQKRRLLAALEAETEASASDDSDEEERRLSAAERLTIEGTIRITDEVVQQKDREIADLKQLLTQQSSNLGSMAVGASAIADMLNKDEIVQQERESLRQMQDEWREKMRLAEIDISLERARMARQRAEVDEKLHTLESEQKRSAQTDTADHPSEPAKKPPRSRWLTRLGLKDEG